MQQSSCLTNDCSANSMGKRVGEDRGVGNKRSVGNNLPDNRESLGVGSGALIADLRDEAIIVVGVVVDSLDTAVREVDRVRSLNNTIAIIGLSLVEGGSRVVVSNSIVVGVGGNLCKVRYGVSSGSLHDGGMVSRGGVDDRGSISWGSVDNRGSIGWGSMDNWSSISRGSMDSVSNWVCNSVSDRMANDTPCSVKSVGRVRD